MNFLRRRYDSYGGGIDIEFDQEKTSLVLSKPMAEEGVQEGDDIGSSSTISKDQRDDDNDLTLKGWLRLGIGGDSTSSSSTRRKSLELKLFPSNIINNQQPRLIKPYSFGNYINIGCPSNQFQVASVPQRRHIGLWFELKALEHQGKRPFLPQVPKSYLRIKDERMTIRLLMKYLANKLGLDDDSEVEVTCRGQQLHPVLTLQYIRDNIWYTRSAAIAMAVTLDRPIAHRVMLLNYCRT